MPRVYGQEPRLLHRRAVLMRLLARLRRPTAPRGPIQPNPRQKLGHTGWVIVQQSLSGRPMRWFGYHRNDVWRWYGNPARAEVFDTRHAAVTAVENCDIQYRSVYHITKLEP